MIEKKYSVNTHTSTGTIDGTISSDLLGGEQSQLIALQTRISYPAVLIGSEIAGLKKEVRELRTKLDEIQKNQVQCTEEKVILIEEMPYKEAKSRIERFIQKKKTTDFGEIQDALHLELKTIVNAVKELMAEEKIRQRD